MTPSSPSKPKTLDWRSDDQFRVTAVDQLALEGAPSSQGGGNVARTCRHFGISRKTFYKWRQRYLQHGDAGLADRARAPHRSPRATPRGRRKRDPLPPAALPLRPWQDCRLSVAVSRVSMACASVHRILRRHGMNRLPANQKYRRHAHRWTRYEKAQPSHRLQVDVKFLKRIAWHPPAFYQFTAIDDCTRIRVLKVLTPARNARPSNSSMTSSGGYPSVSMSFKPTMVPSSNRTFVGISNRSTSATSTSGRAHHT